MMSVMLIAYTIENDICKVIDLVIHPEVADNLAKDVNLR